MPQVLNKRVHGQPPGSVYIGRPSLWGNPFSHKDGTLAQFKVSTRDEAVERYKAWLLDQPELVARARRELAGKDLVCWCAPARCHGHVLVEVANMALKAESAPVQEAAPLKLTGQFRRGVRRP